MDKEKIFVEQYEINPYTMMIKPATTDDQSSEIIEVDQQYISSCKPFDIVKRSCKFFGSSYKGRKEGTRQLIGITHKAPIIVDPYSSIFLFPTASPLSPHCIWISHDFVASHTKSGSTHSTLVTFQNHETYEIPISFHSFENQMSRTAMLRIKFTQNMRRMENYGKHFAPLHSHRAAEQRGSYWTNH